MVMPLCAGLVTTTRAGDSVLGSEIERLPGIRSGGTDRSGDVD